MNPVISLKPQKVSFGEIYCFTHFHLLLTQKKMRCSWRPTDKIIFFVLHVIKQRVGLQLWDKDRVADCSFAVTEKQSRPNPTLISA